MIHSLLTPRLPACGVQHVRMKPRSFERFAAASAARVETAKAKPVVDVGWLKNKLAEPTTKVLDASWYLPPAGRNPVEEYKTGHIPGAQFFDVNSVTDATDPLPHMLPTETAFSAAADALGIEDMDHVVVYDGMGLFSAARAWWTFKVFGHQNVSVLDGGLAAWKNAGLEIESGPEMTEKEILKATEACLHAKEGKTKYPARLDTSQVRNLERMMGLLRSRDEQVIDARSAGRFYGKTPEPREGLRSGHIPDSLNIPHVSVLTPDGHLKSKEELTEILKEAGVESNKDVVCTCGSGVTACIIALVLAHTGFDQHVAVYDGSWSEWGACSDTPVDL